MSYEHLQLERRDRIAVLTLNRPDRLNAWNQAMREEMRDAVRSLVEDDELRVLVVTGAGRAFSAGEDVRGMEGLTEVGQRGFRRRVRMIHGVFDEIEAMEVPVIAALNGVVAGGGMELALSCDFRFAAEGARLGFPENNVGLIPGSGGCSRLVKLVGPAKAKRLVMTGEMIEADAALALGLVDEVIPADKLMEQVLSFADTLAKKAPLALGMAKLVINQCLDVSLATGRNLERLGQSGLKLSDDHREGAQAFIEKRPPDFKGR